MKLPEAPLQELLDMDGAGPWMKVSRKYTFQFSAAKNAMPMLPHHLMPLDR